MKKIFFAALAAVALTACVADVVTEEPTYAIDIVSSAKGTVKSNVVTSLNSFQVFAFNGDNVIMPNMTVTNTGSGWTYSPKKYWPAQGSVDFYGVYVEGLDAAAAKQNAVTKEGEYGFTYEAGTTKGLEFSVNMSKADNVVNAANVPDAVYAAAMDKTKDAANNPVQMTFRHAMAQVDFNIFNNTTAADEVTVTSGDVYVDGLKCDGKYIVNNITTSTAEDSPKGAWTLTNNNISYLFGKNETTIAAGVKSQSILNGNCLVFPQTTGESEVTFKVKCTIKQKGVVIFDNFKTAKATIDWSEGYKYTYTFVLVDGNLTDNLIKLSAAVVGYKDGTGTGNGNVTIPEDPNEPENE